MIGNKVLKDGDIVNIDDISQLEVVAKRTAGTNYLNVYVPGWLYYIIPSGTTKATTGGIPLP